MFVLDHDGGEVRQQRIIDPAVYVGYLIENAVSWKIEFAMLIERNEKKSTPIVTVHLLANCFGPSYHGTLKFIVSSR